jgi:hypothetical protein
MFINNKKAKSYYDSDNIETAKLILNKININCSLYVKDKDGGQYMIYLNFDDASDGALFQLKDSYLKYNAASIFKGKNDEADKKYLRLQVGYDLEKNEWVVKLIHDLVVYMSKYAEDLLNKEKIKFTGWGYKSGDENKRKIINSDIIYSIVPHLWKTSKGIGITSTGQKMSPVVKNIKLPLKWDSDTKQLVPGMFIERVAFDDKVSPKKPGVKIIDNNLYNEWIGNKRKFRTEEDLDLKLEYAEKFKECASELKDKDSEPLNFDNINKILKAKTKLEYLTFHISGLYITPQNMSCSAQARHIFYDPDSINGSINDPGQEDNNDGEAPETDIMQMVDKFIKEHKNRKDTMDDIKKKITKEIDENL